MEMLRIQPVEFQSQDPGFARERHRLRVPIVGAVLAAYLTIAALQSQQMVYFVVLAPLALIALEVAFEIADKLEGR